jgi:hypothetical protein
VRTSPFNACGRPRGIGAVIPAFETFKHDLRHRRTIARDEQPWKHVSRRRTGTAVETKIIAKRLMWEASSDPCLSS